MQIAHCILKQGHVWAVPSRAYWTGISVLPENWLSSAGTGVEPTTLGSMSCITWSTSSEHALRCLVQIQHFFCSALLFSSPQSGVGCYPQVMKIKPKPSNLSDDDSEPWS